MTGTTRDRLPSVTTMEAPIRRLLILNPNGNPAVNALLASLADRVLPTGIEARVLNPPQSPLSIQTPADRAEAEPLALDLMTRNPGYDAYVMACFDDIALTAGRRVMNAPVIGPVEASVTFARQCADRFAVVTTVEGAVPGIRRALASLGAAQQCAVRAAGIGVAAAAKGSAAADRCLDAAIRHLRDEHEAQVIILGSAGLAGRAQALAMRHGLPVIDAMEAAIRLAAAIAAGDSRQLSGVVARTG